MLRHLLRIPFREASRTFPPLSPKRLHCFGASLLVSVVSVVLTAPQAHADMTLRFEGTQRLGAQRVAMAGQTLRLQGSVTPYVPGQVVTVRVNVGPRRVMLVRRTIAPVAGHGEFTLVFPVRRPGAVRASALHEPTPALGRQAASAAPVTSFVPAAGRGARGLRVRFLQSRLAALGYAVNRNGRYDASTGRAVLAYRKANLMARVQSPASRLVFRRLAAGRGGFVVRYPGHGRHVEADLGRQVLALVNPGGRVFRVYHMSSGAPATPTVLGSFRFYRKTPGTNSLGMVHSSYFIGGYAIHGYRSVPTRPASHGCLRIPIANARFVHDWIRPGMRIDVYYRRPGVRSPPPRANAGP